MKERSVDHSCKACYMKERSIGKLNLILLLYLGMENGISCISEAIKFVEYDKVSTLPITNAP